MKKIVIMGFVVAILFGVSAASSWLLQQNQVHPSEGEDSAGPSAEKGTKASPTSSAHQGASPANASEPRPAVRAAFNAEAETTAHLAANLRNQMDAVKTREQQLATRQKQMEIIYLDIRGERGAIDEMRKQLAEEMKNATEKLDVLDRKAGEMDKKGKQLHDKAEELSSSYRKIDESEKDNLKKMGTMYDSMDADAAAQTLQQMADSGKMDTAAKILSTMRERQAAKVLAQLTDRTTAVQLLEQMRKLQRPAAAGANGIPD
jgi:flagellar motility protein MotE (MotC chaperone)